MKRVAFFISSHGFGHAARCCAVIEQILKKEKSVFFEIFTTVPEFFFLDSLTPDQFRYHNLLNDIGLIQPSPLSVDFDATIEALSKIIPYNKDQFKDIKKRMAGEVPDLIVSDISPLGLAYAKYAGIESILFENFTWDWIYETLVPYHNRFSYFTEQLRDVFKSKDHHIQMTPFCLENPDAVQVPPVSRSVRNDADEIRSSLNIPLTDTVVLITMGGFSGVASLPDHLNRADKYHFVVTGRSESKRLSENVVHLEAGSDYFHPDLVNTADIVVGKPGYSTISETYNSGGRFGYFIRPGYRESDVLEKFIINRMASKRLENFESGEWIDQLESLLNTEAESRKNVKSGAEICAEYIKNLL